MSHDPWMEDSNSLDLTEGLEDRVHVPFVYTRDHAEWLTADGQASFARGTEASVDQSQEEAYAAMAMKDTLSSPFGLDSACPTLGLSDVRAQPLKKDEGYPTLATEGDLPDTTAIIRTLMSHCDLIMNNQMIYLIVDNRVPADVPHWPAFAAWWASRRCLVGPQEETTDILWVCADATTGLHKVPYYWAGVFVLEVARFLYPAQHFALIDNDCVPVTLFEVQDLLQLAHQQHQWVDLLGRARSESSSCAGIGMLLFTEAHLEYNAGLVVSIGNRSKHSPLEQDATASTLAKSLQAGRLALVSRARPPVNPSDTVISGTMFTPFVGVAMQTALDLCMVWSLYGLYMCKHFWPSPVTTPAELGPDSTIKWPRQSHPRALTPAGRERTPWVTSWARATFEQGILSVLPMLTGPCTVASLPGEHLFHTSRTNSPKQALTRKTFWPSQPLVKGPRTYAINFSIAEKKANAETAVKVAGATAKHCIVIHGVSTFLSGEGRHLDYDQECFTRANVAYSRATDLTILACPLNMQGMPGALQVLAALLHGVQTIYTYDSNEEPTVFGSSSSHSGCASHDILPTGTSAPSNVARPSAGLSRRTPSRQGEALTPRLSHDYALDQSRNYQPRRRVLPAWWYGVA